MQIHTYVSVPMERPLEDIVPQMKRVQGTLYTGRIEVYPELSEYLYLPEGEYPELAGLILPDRAIACADTDGSGNPEEYLFASDHFVNVYRFGVQRIIRIANQLLPPEEPQFYWDVSKMGIHEIQARYQDLNHLLRTAIRLGALSADECYLLASSEILYYSTSRSVPFIETRSLDTLIATTRALWVGGADTESPRAIWVYTFNY